MKSKINLAFEKCKKEKRPALITYTVAGDNNKNNSPKNIKYDFKACRYSRTWISS